VGHGHRPVREVYRDDVSATPQRFELELSANINRGNALAPGMSAPHAAAQSGNLEVEAGRARLEQQTPGRVGRRPS